MHDANLLEDQPIAWTPTPEVIERAQLTKFMRQVGVSTWDELYQFSIRDVEKFTEEVLKFLDIRFDPPYEKLLDTSNGVEFPVWFRSADTPVRMSAKHENETQPSSDLVSTKDLSAETDFAGGADRSADTLVRMSAKHENETQPSSDSSSTQGLSAETVFAGGADRSADTLVRMSAKHENETQPSRDSVSTQGLPAERSFAGGTGDEDKSVLAPTAGLNITTMCLDRWDNLENRGREAIVWRPEDSNEEGEDWSYGELIQDVQLWAAGLRDIGIKKGDAVGLHLPMVPETIVSLLAINRIGAIAVPVFSGYGVEAVASRLQAVNVVALFAATGFPRRGKMVDSLSVSVEAVRLCPSVKHLFVVENYGLLTDREIDLPGILVRTFLDIEPPATFEENDLLGKAEPTSAEDPLIILYTSGTTGKPKGIAHTHASFPIKAAQDMAFGTDVGRGTRISWYTDIGWMMGPWLIYGALINGATICIYDGAPDYPTPDRMWEFVAKHKVEILGISPTLIRSLARSGDTPVPIGGSSAEAFSEHQSGVREDKSVLAPAERRGWSRHGHLPHFDGEVIQFITFRLADSLPAAALQRLKLQLEHDRLTDDSEEYRNRVEDYLDQGAGECILRDPNVAAIVRDAILYEHERSCNLKAWVIMPNHAHLLLRMKQGHDLAGLMKRVKGISARRINQLLGTQGTIWQSEYFDRYIGDAEHYSRVFRYIENNPVVAKLTPSAEDWQFGSAYRSEDTLVLAPFQRHDLSSLRAFASTGEPWNPAPWWWLFEKVGNSKLPIINYSGGTEIAGGILMGNMLLPQKPCSFPAPCPGMDVDILDEEGNSVEAGKVGELVIKQPWIGMARGFWQERERYLDTYWRRFKDIWVHGDWAMRDSDGHYFILGRSDDTLKVAGKRVGPAEVESLLVAHPEVIEAAVIGVPDEAKGTAMVAFAVLTGEQASLLAADDEEASKMLALQSELKSLVARDMGKPLAPSRIHFVSALPKTRNAKVMRRVIRSAYLGEDPGDLSALENPQTVEEIAELSG